MARFSPFSWTLLALVVVFLVPHADAHFKRWHKKVKKPFIKMLPVQSTAIALPKTKISIKVNKAGFKPLFPQPLPNRNRNYRRETFTKYWDILANNRMDTVMECELRLWDMTQSKLLPGDVTIMSSSQTKLTQQARNKRSQPRRLSAGVHYSMPLNERKNHIREMEKVLGECSLGVMKMEEKNSVQRRCVVLMQDIQREMDQIKACKCVGGHTTQVGQIERAVGRVWGSMNRRRPVINVHSLLMSSMNRLKIARHSCLRSLKLPIALTKKLGYPCLTKKFTKLTG